MNKGKRKKSNNSDKVPPERKVYIPVVPNKVVKKIKIIKNKEELPSFLLNLPPKTEEIATPAQNKNYLGPLFFGGCRQYHPLLHSLHFTNVHVVTHPVVSTEDLLKNFFLPETLRTEKTTEKPFRPRVVRSKVFKDSYPHKCPGTRKAFLPEFDSFQVNFGETESPIEGETSREIPLCRPSTSSSRGSEEELEIVTPSDLREMKRMFMSENERAAHSHFPKEFVSVRIIGPKIPASITFKKLPTKRKKLSELKTPPLSHTQIIDEREKEDNLIDDEDKVEEDEFTEDSNEDADVETNDLLEDIITFEENTEEHIASEEVELFEEFEDIDNESEEMDNEESDNEDTAKMNLGTETEFY